MATVRLSQPLKINLTGYDRQALELPAGEHDVSERVATFVAEHPEFGEVIPEPAVSSQVEILMGAIPGLTKKQAEALDGAGYGSLEALAEVDNATLAEIDGVAAGTIAKIREVVPEPGSEDQDEETEEAEEPADEPDEEDSDE